MHITVQNVETSEEGKRHWKQKNEWLARKYQKVKLDIMAQKAHQGEKKITRKNHEIFFILVRAYWHLK